MVYRSTITITMTRNTIRKGCVEITIHPDLEVSYRINLPLKEDYLVLFTDQMEKYVQWYTRNGKQRFQFVFESKDRLTVNRVLLDAQIRISLYKAGKEQQKAMTLISMLEINNETIKAELITYNKQ
jgi:hypothetical protein